MREFKEFTPLPNELLEALSKAQMQGIITGREGGVIGFIIRNTYGYQKEVNTLKTSFIARELGTTPDYISHILKRLEKKNIIVRDGDEIALNKHYKEWKTIKLPNHFQNIDNGVNTDNGINIGNNGDDNGINKKVTAISPYSDSPDTSEPQQAQINPESKECLNKTIKENINKTRKRERYKERKKITFNKKYLKLENIPKEKLNRWCEAYPNCNVEVEIKKMEVWLTANPTRHKKNYEQFIVNWLGRAEGENKRYIPIPEGKVKFTGRTADAGEW